MAVSVYDEQLLTEEQKKQLQAFTDAWNRANAAGDKAGMESAHAAAERVRSQAGYSGGADGSGYAGLGEYGSGYSSLADYGSGYAGLGGYGDAAGTADAGRAAGDGRASGGAYEPAQLPSYRAQTEAVNSMYDAARDAELAGLRAAFEASSAQLESEREKIPGIYDAQRNLTAAEAERAARSFNEYAAASGLNSGTGGQARLAMSNELQGDLALLGAQEAQAQRELEGDMSQLKLKYQNDIASAVASGEYKRAAALLEEYRREQESAVSVAGAQADENYRAWQSRFAMEQYDYSRDRDAAEDARRLEEERYERAQAAEKAGADMAGDQWQRQLELAELMAKYGDYSGLRALGVDIPEPAAASQSGASQSTSASKTAGSTGTSKSTGASKSTSATKSTSTSKSSGGSSGSGKVQDYDGLYAAALASGKPKSFIANNYKSYGFTSSTGLYSEYESWLESDPEANEIKDWTQLGPEAKRILYGFARSYATQASDKNAVSEALKQGLINEYEADFLLKAAGFDR